MKPWISHVSLYVPNAFSKRVSQADFELCVGQSHGTKLAVSSWVLYDDGGRQWGQRTDYILRTN